MAFVSYAAKERFRKAAIEKLKSTTYNNMKVFVAEDLSQCVLELRKKKSPLFKHLKEEGKHPFHISLECLCYRDATGKLIKVNK